MKKAVNKRILEENASKTVREIANEHVFRENALKREKKAVNERILKDNASKWIPEKSNQPHNW